MRSDIAPGGTFPDYELPDHENVSRRLSELQGDDPMILTLARGHYCPKEHQQHLELAVHYPKTAVAHTRVATIATDETRPDWDLSRPGLRDAWDAGDWAPFHGWDKRTAAAQSAA
jgi:hypothetical protein